MMIIHKEVSGITVYQDICTEIEILKLRAEDQERDLQYARRKMSNTGLPMSNGKVVVVPLDRALEEYDAALVKLQETLAVLEEKEKVRKQIETTIKNLKGLETQVAYYRDALGLSLKVIAELLGYSLDHIKRVSAQISRRKKQSS